MREPVKEIKIKIERQGIDLSKLTTPEQIAAARELGLITE
jgi:hypothetical protein